MALPRSRTNSGGATLVELLIVVVLLGILGVYGSTMFSDNYRTVRAVEAGKTSGDQLRYAVDRISREVREIRWVDSATGYSITSTLAPSATSLAFTRNIGGSSVAVSIGLNGTDLQLGYTPPGTTSTLAKQVTSFGMNFYTVDPVTGAVSATTDKTNVRFVELTITSTDSQSGQVITERTRVGMRNG